MAIGWKERATFWIEVFTMVVFSIILFEYVLHPVLVDIDPMFSWEHAAGDIGGRAPDSPAGVALAITSLIFYISYREIKLKIVMYYQTRSK